MDLNALKNAIENDLMRRSQSDIEKLAGSLVNQLSRSPRGGLSNSFTLQASGMTGYLTNKATSENGTRYFKYWLFGRGPVMPVRAKALHWDNIFARYAGPAPDHLSFIRQLQNQIVPVLQNTLRSMI